MYSNPAYRANTCPYITVQQAHHVESTSIRRRYYVDTSKTKFRPILYHIFFGRIHCYKLTLVKNHFLLQKKKKYKKPKKIYKKVVPSQREKLFRRFENKSDNV